MILNIEFYKDKKLYYCIVQTVNSLDQYKDICEQHNIISSIEDMSFDLTRDEVYIRKEIL